MMFNGKLTVTHHHLATVQEISVEMNGFSFLSLLVWQTYKRSVHFYCIVGGKCRTFPQQKWCWLQL